MAGGINRFNRISSKEWLPFQKSWFRFDSEQDWIRSNFRFFTTREESDASIFYHGSNENLSHAEARELGFAITLEIDQSRDLQFAFLDLREEVNELNPENWPAYRDEIIQKAKVIFDKLMHRRFLMVALPNIYMDGRTYPFAWDLACELGKIYTLKDEKIAGLDKLDGGHFYTLYFRKDEQSGAHQTISRDFFKRIESQTDRIHAGSTIPSWFILKPQRRKKNEVVHPAKYPEDLAELFVQKYTQPTGNVFDPMSGTGSTQVAALRHSRNGYGVELSSFFAEIARERCLSYLFDASTDPDNKQDLNRIAFDVIQGDARKSNEYGFPIQDLIVTSPPYWDMLNMKGAENQANRIKKGLKTNYSEDTSDLGNISDYQDFIHELTRVYFDVIKLLKPGGHLVIVVKNIKKKGKNYPFAWDIAAMLQEKLILKPEVFWCQDDISIAPYGYGSTFVSNTFHQYCLVFQKPGN